MFELLGTHRKVSPRSIYGIGRNYLKHIEELKNDKPDQPVVFLKSQASLRAFDHPLPNLPEQVFYYEDGIHYEAEITLLIGRYLPLGASPTARDILGIGLGLDLTRRTVQDQLKAKGLPWTRAKSFAGSSIITPFCPMTDAIDLSHLCFQFSVNGVIKQTGESQLMIFPILDLLKSLCQFICLLPGDLIFTGTPEGVGSLRRGDQIKLAWNSPFSHEFSTVF